ncbi:MAG: MerR family transcriptional regulator [Spirochaetota bacterium]
MRGYGIGDVEVLLGIPASTLRFWEKEVPYVAPRKDVFGRRVYGTLDLCTLARLRHLALDLGLGLGEAKARMEEELVGGDQSWKAEITELKASLLSLLADLKRLENKSSS